MIAVAPGVDVLIEMRARLADLYAAYDDALGEGDYERWPEFFTEACVYKIIPRENYDAGLPLALMQAESRGMLVDRVTSLRRVLMYEAHRYRHLVGPTRIMSLDGEVAETRSNVIVARIMHSGETSLFATGRYLDRIAVAGEPYRFVERLVVLDSQKIDTLIAIPL